ncbi:hypothetical protein N0V85_005667 [Neurospora sp. IMI 360204]|nr:hypothetical protein N0V85_005667 [Neurospora sp. IMI 360204]
MSEALEAVIPLCPQLRAFHLLCSRKAPPDPLPGHSSAPWPLSLPIGKTLFNSNPLLTTLTVDFRALAGALKPSRFAPLFLQRRHLLPATITHLSLIGHPLCDVMHVTPMSLLALSTWLSEKHGLRSLRVLNGLAQTTQAETWNWNTILLRYKHSLEEVELDGRALLLHQPFSATKLMGPAIDFGVLSCLGQMERLKVIKVPLHYLKRVRVQEGWGLPELTLLK